jgi:hypothetical protein
MSIENLFKHIREDISYTCGSKFGRETPLVEVNYPNPCSVELRDIASGSFSSLYGHTGLYTTVLGISYIASSHSKEEKRDGVVYRLPMENFPGYILVGRAQEYRAHECKLEKSVLKQILTRPEGADRQDAEYFIPLQLEDIKKLEFVKNNRIIIPLSTSGLEKFELFITALLE